MTEDKREKFSEEEINKILELLSKAYKDSDKTLETAVLYKEGDDIEKGEGTFLIDNRDKEKEN